MKWDRKTIIGLVLLAPFIPILFLGGYIGRSGQHSVPMCPKVRKLLNQGYDVHKMIRNEYPNIKVRRVGKS